MIRVLFVDDEMNVLQAMRRTMHCMKREWDMEFQPNAAAALESLAKTPADVIVTDMRMPGMDGWQLLAQVKKLYPQTARLVLSGQADPGAIMKLAGTAHQYLSKPSDSESLRAAIAQTQLLKQLLSNDQLALVVGKVGTLPSCPKAFQEISSCLQQPDAAIADVARIIARDVAMTANIMKLVNSAFFGARQSITNVERAVAYLGLDTLTALVLGHSLFKGERAGHNGEAGLASLWQHSFQTATVARTIARYEKMPAARIEEAFLTGMLHDVGRVVLADPGAAMASGPANCGANAAAEIQRHHAEAGAYLLGLWGFPSHIVEAVALHDSPGKRAGSGLELTALIHIADHLTHHRGGKRPDVTGMGIEPGLLESIGLLEHLPEWLTALDSLGTENATP